MAGALLACLLLASCAAADDAAKYGDDLITAVRRITGQSADEAIGLLDDAARAGRPLADEVLLITWSTRIGRMADELPAAWYEAPDDVARARSFVVGTACDAFEQYGSALLVTESDVRQIVNDNWRTSGLPDILATPLFLGEVARAIHAALLDGDLTRAYPEVARLAVCEVVG
jgi:hypothetical protein